MVRALLLVIFLPVLSHSQVIKYRNYKPGEKFRYRLTTATFRNGEYTGETRAVSEHTVIKDSGVFTEEIRWISKIKINARQYLSFDTLYKNVSPYNISLSPKGKVLLPKLNVPDMVGDITDLNTFYVAIAPALNAQKLSLKNKSFTNSELRQGHFADSIVIMYGTDCIQVTQTLLESTKEYAVVETKFTPPPSFCLTPLLDTVAASSSGQFNNIQMIQKSPDGKLNLFWGVETFTITIKIAAKSGKILHAVMDNYLTLRMRYDSSPDLETYVVEMPVTIKRHVELELIQ